MILDVNRVRQHLLSAESAATRQKYDDLSEKLKTMDKKDLDLFFFQILGQLADSGGLHTGESTMYRQMYDSGDHPGPTFVASLFTLAEVASS